MNKGKLYMIPNFLEEESLHVLPVYLKDAIESCSMFLVEHAKVARKLLIGMGLKEHINKAEWELMDKKGNDPITWIEWLNPCLNGENVGIISDAGCPGVADPGADIAKMAHEMGIQVVPLVGPSSILMGLMASGLNGQSFSFWGYLPIESRDRSKRLRELEKQSKQFNQTQIFIETPYRNNQMMKEILNACHPETQICIASNITAKNELIQTKSVKNWKGKLPEINKIPAVFYLLAK